MLNNISFYGYDARPLKGVFTRDGGFGPSFFDLARETAQILNKEGVDVFVQTPEKILKNDFPVNKTNFSNFWPWVQDRLTFFPDKKIESKKLMSEDSNLVDVKNLFKFRVEEKNNFIEGGNYFFIKDGKEDSVILGKDELQSKSLKAIKDFFGNRKVYVVSQPDFHLDLSIRPLNDKRILINDLEMLVSELDKGIKRATQLFNKNKEVCLATVIRRLKSLKNEILESDKQYNITEKYKALEQELKNNKFNIVKVPGLVIKSTNIRHDISSKYLNDIMYKMNFMNALVHQRSDGSLVYIASKSVLDEQMGITQKIAKKIDFSFEQMFKKSLKGIIANEDVHFVGNKTISNILKNNYGSIHCLFSEIPNFY